MGTANTLPLSKMQLRPRQVKFVDSCLSALKSKNNTLGVAPTGAGKTVMLSAVIKDLGVRTLVLQHRDELVSQNMRTFKAVAPGVSTDVYNASRKRWAEGTTFAMVQTLSRDENIDSIPILDLVVIDEAHHVAAKTYKKILDRIKYINPKVKIFGVTATPQRGDHVGVADVFNNVSDVIKLSELIVSGFLVRPKFFVIDCNIRKELQGISKTKVEYNMEEASIILNSTIINERVVKEWEDKAKGRKTVVFCSTIAHAEAVNQTFLSCSYKSDIIHGELDDKIRAKVLKEFDEGKINILVNVAVLTEGWDCQDVACVILLRPCSYKSTMIQMIGRGLRKVDPERYPGVVKDDCVVLDFGYSVMSHGSIDADVKIEGSEADEKLTKICDNCQTEIPYLEKICPVCGFSFEKEPVDLEVEKGELSNFTMTEVDLLNLSPYFWQDLYDGSIVMANALSAWAVLVNYENHWFAVGKVEGGKCKVLMVSKEKITALSSADDFLREYGDADAAKKTKRWLFEPASTKQLAYMPEGMVFGITKYYASCQMTWNFNETFIQNVIEKQNSKLKTHV
jgi:superfamily II DNA or RNA helicase